MEIEDDPLTEAEYTAVKKSIKEGRACGPETRTLVQKRSYTTTESWWPRKNGELQGDICLSHCCNIGKQNDLEQNRVKNR